MWSALVFLVGMIFLRMASKDMSKKEVVKCRQKKNCARCDVAHRGRRNNLPNHKPGRVCLCDFLWALSLFQSIVIHLGEDHIRLAIGVGIAFCIVCEFSQLTEMIPGTFDLNDLLVELSAGVITLMSLVNRRIMDYEKST